MAWLIQRIRAVRAYHLNFPNSHSYLVSSLAAQFQTRPQCTSRLGFGLGWDHLELSTRSERASHRLHTRGWQMTMAVRSLRHHVVQAMAAHQGRVLTTGEIYQLVAARGGRLRPQSQAGPQPGQPGAIGPVGPQHPGPQQARAPAGPPGGTRPLPLP